MTRDECSYQFELQSHRLGLKIKQRLRNYRYVLVDQQRGHQYTAMVLVESFDFYTYRLNRGKERVDLLIVAHHNALVPLRVISMGESRDYAAATLPELERPERKRRNQDEVKVFLSSLIVGSKQALAELEHMQPRIQRRWLKRRDTYLKPRVGRPQAS